MTRRVVATRSLGTGPLVTALGSAVLAAAALGSAPAANATCASLFGIGNSASCTSNLTSIAIAIGPNARAHADGLFGTAFAIGNVAEADVLKGAAFNTATAIGDYSSSSAAGYLSGAVTFGSKSIAAAGGAAQFANIALAVGHGQGGALADGYGNIAVNILTRGDVGGATAEGALNLAVNGFGTASSTTSSAASAFGLLNTAVNVFGKGNQVTVGHVSSHAIASWGFAVGGGSNTVSAGPGPFAIAGSVGQHHSTVSKTGPGININGIVVGVPAAAQPASAAAARAAGGDKKHHRHTGAPSPAPAHPQG